MTVTSNPTGAVVWLNDREMGRTPFTRQFLWYGNYDVVARKDGYQTTQTVAAVNAPFWQFVPLDAVTNFLPLKDEHTIQVELKPEEPVDPQALLARGQAAQLQLQSTERTVNRSVLLVHPTSKPTTAPSTQEAPPEQ
jgi:hypothetical protein